MAWNARKINFSLGTPRSGTGDSWSGGSTSPVANPINPAQLQDKLTADYEQARLARQQRYEQGIGLFGQIADLYQPGGAFEQAAMNQYQTGKRQAMSSGMQNLISSGLAKSSTPAALERGYEATVGTPFRTAVAAEGQGRLATAYQNMANYMAGFPDVYPEAGTLAHLATGGFGALNTAAAQGAAQTAANYAASGGSLWGQNLLGGGGGGGGTTGGGGGYSGGGSIASPFASNPYRTGGGTQQSTSGSPSFGQAFLGNPEFTVGQGGGLYTNTTPPVSELASGEQIPVSKLTQEQLNPPSSEVERSAQELAKTYPGAHPYWNPYAKTMDIWIPGKGYASEVL